MMDSKIYSLARRDGRCVGQSHPPSPALSLPQQRRGQGPVSPWSPPGSPKLGGLHHTEQRVAATTPAHAHIHAEVCFIPALHISQHTLPNIEILKWVFKESHFMTVKPFI